MTDDTNHSTPEPSPGKTPSIRDLANQRTRKLIDIAPYNTGVDPKTGAPYIDFQVGDVVKALGKSSTAPEGGK